MDEVDVAILKILASSQDTQMDDEEFLELKCKLNKFLLILNFQMINNYHIFDNYVSIKLQKY